MRVASRRTFVRLLLAGAAGLAAASWGLLGPLRTVMRRLGPPALDDSPPGAISAELKRVLLAATRAVVSEPIDEEHYAAFFRWRAEHLRGHHALYERFRAAVDRDAVRATGVTFAQSQAATQRQILRRAFVVRAGSGAIRDWRGRSVERDWILFDRHILREVLALFARTDAWVLLGYEAWPGAPRGFEHYRSAPRRKA